MTSWKLWAHSEVEESISSLDAAVRESVRRKVEWAEVQLACRGETTIMKGVQGHDVRWRRTPVKGNEYYLWWAKTGTRGFESLTPEVNGHDILVRKVRQHDLTSTFLDPGAWENYSPVDVPSLDPRFTEQADILPATYSLMSVKTVNGYPGSGKTIALLYAARDLNAYGHILYVTYTDALAREARAFFETIGLGQDVSVRTLAQLESDILGNDCDTVELSSPALAYRRFATFVAQTYARNHSWMKGAELALWEQVRAYLFGMALPFDWRRGVVHIPKCDCLSSDLYTQIFGEWDHRHLNLLYRLAEQAHEQGFCTEQTRARDALNAVLGGELAEPPWMANLCALVVDEIQDLTPLQIALLAEVAQLAHGRTPDHAYPYFAFITAGDESQIVQPSGFEWTIAKDLLHDRLHAVPEPIEFQHQRRSPRRLAHLLNNTWSLYMRDRRRREQPQALPDDGEEGKVLRCRMEGNWGWAILLEALASSPGRVVVDLDGTFDELVSEIDEIEEHQRAVVYTPQDIKGLDRRTVLVWHLGKAIAEHGHLADAGGFPGMQARHVIGSIRVALSRPTETLVILEHNEPEELSVLRLTEIGVRVVDLDGLLRYLEQEEFSDEERLEGFLREADEALDRDDLDRAAERNRRGRDLLEFVDDPTLIAQAAEQHETIRRRRIEPILQEAARQLERGNVQAALAANERAERALEETDAPSLRDAVHHQREEIKRYPVESAMKEADAHWEARNFDKALAANGRAAEAVGKLRDASLHNAVHSQRSAICEDYVGSLLQVAETQLRRGDLQSALASNEHAKRILEQGDAQSFRKQVRDQSDKLERAQVEELIREADERLRQGMTDDAREINKRAASLCKKSGLEDLKATLSAQRTRIKLVERLGEAEACKAKKDYLATYRLYRSANSLAYTRGLTPEEVSAYEPRIRSIRRWLDPELDQLARRAMFDGIKCIDTEDWSNAANALQTAADIRTDQDRPDAAAALQCLADRYAQCPPPVDPESKQMEMLVDLAARYTDALETTGTGADERARRFAEEWLQEALPAVGAQPRLLLDWVACAKRVAGWSELDIPSLFEGMSHYLEPALIELAGTSADPRVIAESFEMGGEDIPPDLQDRCELMSYAEELL